MKQALHILLLFGVIAVQIAAPAWLIQDHERLLEEGTAYAFKTALVDPADPFRGRYVVFELALMREALPVDEADDAALRDAARGDPVYLELTRGEDGAGGITRVSATPPEGDYLRAELREYDSDGRLAQVRYPRQRYYVPEDVAPEAERLFMAPPEGQTPEVTLRVEGRRQIIEQITIGGTPLTQYIREGAGPAS